MSNKYFLITAAYVFWFKIIKFRRFFNDSNRLTFDSLRLVNQSAIGLYCSTSIAKILLIVSALKPVVIIKSVVLMPER